MACVITLPCRSWAEPFLWTFATIPQKCTFYRTRRNVRRGTYIWDNQALWILGDKSGKKQILEYLKAHKDEFAQKYQIDRLALFGSFAKDTERPDSDIDILI
jgi:hypothetical protein